MMLLGLLAGLLIALGWSQPWTQKDNRYWSVGLGLMLAGGGILSGMSQANLAYSLVTGIAGGLSGFLIGAIFDIVVRYRRRSKLSLVGSETPAQKTTGSKDSRDWPSLNTGQSSGQGDPTEGSRESQAIAMDAYEVAGRELLENRMKPGPWARALTQAGDNENSIHAAYVRIRVEELETEQSAAKKQSTAKQPVAKSSIRRTFGYSANDPILCQTTGEELQYISRLRPEKEGLVAISEAGSVTSVHFDKPVNKWKMELENGEVRTIYVFAHHETQSEIAPRGLFLKLEND